MHFNAFKWSIVALKKTVEPLPVINNPPLLIKFCFLNVWGEVASDLNETWWNFFLQASRSFLYSPGTSETTRNPQNSTFYVL